MGVAEGVVDRVEPTIRQEVIMHDHAPLQILRDRAALFTGAIEGEGQARRRVSIERGFTGRRNFLAEPTVPGTQPLPPKCRKPQCDNVGIDLSRVSIRTLHIELDLI
jgi:hypothetical protein